MSTLFESLKKLEQKEKQATQAASKVSVVSGEKSNSGLSPKWLAMSIIIFAVVFIGFAIFTHFGHQELKTALSSERSSLDSRFKDLVNQIQGATKGIDGTKQMVVQRLNSFAQELEKQRNAQNKFTVQQTKSIEQNKSALQAQIDEKFNLLSRRISLLEASEQKEVPPQERRID